MVIAANVNAHNRSWASSDASNASMISSRVLAATPQFYEGPPTSSDGDDTANRVDITGDITF
ncbi:MAG: hypothetical protein CK429_08645 [Mycobacterium sp.]|nr:MAG: hypothetical protein CK429_08645 [Mycobacterium sp.]